MKLEDQRIMGQKSIHTIDPQFLTFRYHTSNNQTSARPINSQRLQYKSSQRYPFVQFPISQCEEVLRQEKIQKQKSKQLRSVKSQQRLAGVRERFLNNNDQIYVEQQYEIEENRMLKKAINRLKKNIDKEKRRQYDLDNELEQLKRQLQQDNQELRKQIESIEQLQDICEYNVEQCEGLKENIRNSKIKNKQLIQQQQKFQKSVESSQISVQTLRQLQLKNGTCVNQLQSGIKQLKQIKKYAQSSVSKLKTNINYIFQYINQIQIIDQQILLIHNQP